MTKPRFGFGMIVLNGEEFIYQSIASVYDFADQIWVADGATPAGREMANKNGGSCDRTLEILSSFPDPEHKLHILPSRFYKDKNEQSNAYMEAMDASPPDYVWQLDSDELYHPDDLERIAQLIEERHAWHVTLRALHFWHNLRTVAWDSWWSSPEQAYHRVNKFEKGWRYAGHRPPTILINGKPIWKARPVINADELEQEGIYLYHYSHVTEKQVRQKMDWYSRDGSWSGNWFEDVWKRWEKEPEWTEKNIGTHPTDVRYPKNLWRKGTTRPFKGTHPPTIKTHSLWRRDYPNVDAANKKTRVLHIVENVSPGGGFIGALHFIIRANQENGQEHHLLILGSSKHEKVSIPAAVTTFEKGKRSTAKCAKWISDADYDILHWHWWHGRLEEMNPLMDEMAKYGGHKRVLTCWVYPAAAEFTPGRRETGYADKIVFAGKDSLEACPHIKPSQKMFVLGGVDLKPFLVSHPRRQNGKFRMGRASTFTPWKFPPTLIKMVLPILEALPEAEFHIFGEGELENKIQEDIQRFNLENRVFLHGWVVNFAEETANLDLYLYHLPPSSFATSELNLQEAMAAGLPIVVMPSTGTRWMFEHGKDALVAENPVEAQEYCIRLAKNPEERIRLGQNARAKALAEFGIEPMVRGYLDSAYPTCRMRFVVNGLIYNKKRGAGNLLKNACWIIYRFARRCGGKILRLCRLR